MRHFYRLQSGGWLVMWVSGRTRRFPGGVLTLLVALLFGYVGSTALAGPHEGGTVILHANPDIIYTSESPGYCGQSGLESCEDAVTRVPADPATTIVFHAMAAFPADSQPELRCVAFGITYDPQRFVLVETGHCAELESNTDGWPLPESGTILCWTSAPQREFLLELRWFAGYATDAELPTAFGLTYHPTEGGIFVGDDPYTPVDEIADYGELGFGTDGYLPCPDNPVPTLEQSWGAVKIRFR